MVDTLFSVVTRSIDFAYAVVVALWSILGISLSAFIVTMVLSVIVWNSVRK